MEEVKREIAAASEDGWERRPPDPLIFLVNRMDNMEHRLRDDIKQAEVKLRDEIKKETGALWQEMAGLKQETGVLKQEVAGLKQEVAGLKQETGFLKQEIAGLKQGTGSLGQDFRALERTVFDKMEANQKWTMRLFATMGLGFAGIIITLLIKLPK